MRAQHLHIEIAQDTTWECYLYLPGTNLTGCTVVQQLRRGTADTTADFTFTSSPAAGITLGTLAAAVTLGNGQVLPIGTAYIRIRWERSKTALMSGSYYHAAELVFPTGSEAEATVLPLIEGPVTVVAEGVL